MSETCGMHGRKTNTYEVKLRKAEEQRPVDRCGHGSDLRNKNKGYIWCNKLLCTVIPALCVGHIVRGLAQDLLLICW